MVEETSSPEQTVNQSSPSRGRKYLERTVKGTRDVLGGFLSFPKGAETGLKVMLTSARILAPLGLLAAYTGYIHPSPDTQEHINYVETVGMPLDMTARWVQFGMELTPEQQQKVEELGNPNTPLPDYSDTVRNMGFIAGAYSLFLGGITHSAIWKKPDYSYRK